MQIKLKAQDIKGKDVGYIRRCGLAVLLALAQGGTGSAIAADPAGSCCADLEERVAELEATTSRKGNRKLSLEVHGFINNAILWWDDGREANAAVVTNENARSRVGIRGKAKISSDLEAGYSLELGVRTINSKRFTQTDPNAGVTNGLDLRDAHWFVKHKTLGAIYTGVGQTSSNGITELSITQTSLVSKHSDVEDSGLGLRLRARANGQLSAINWFRLLGDGGDQPGEGERVMKVVRYESPVLAGFVVGGSWGEDDVWDVALRYSGEGGGFKYAAGIGYGEVLDATQTQTVCATAAGTPAGGDTNCRNFGGSFSVLHEPTGIFLNAAAGIKVDMLLSDTVRFAGTGADDDQDFWAMQAGIEKPFSSFGKTTLYGEYYAYEGGANGVRTLAIGDAANPLATTATIWSSGVEMFGLGVIQGFDKAAMQLYLSYRHYEADLTVRGLAGGVATGAISNVGIEDIDIVMSGALVKF